MRWTKWGFTANESFFLFFLPTIAGYQQLSFIKSLFPIPSQRKWIPEALLELKSSDRSNQLCLMVCTALLERNAQLCRRRQKPIKFFAAYFHLCSTRSTLHLKANTHLLCFHYCTIYYPTSWDALVHHLSFALYADLNGACFYLARENSFNIFLLGLCQKQADCTVEFYHSVRMEKLHVGGKSWDMAGD